MYCEFFGFKEPPFSITPNPRFIFLSKNHQEAFAHLIYGIKSHAGFIELIGEVGTGKTTILRSLINQLNDDAHRTALVFNPRLSSLELLRTINREFGITIDGSIDELTHSLNQFLLEENRAGRTVVLVIDEAQNLEPAVLEQIRMISNLETNTEKLIQIVLAGQPELGEILQKESLRQLSQRITVRFTLLPLDFNDMRLYIEHRLEIAGGWHAATFTTSALKKIFNHTQGLPRLVNLLCDRILLIAFTEETREITAKIVTQAIKETRSQGSGNLLANRKLAFGILCAIFLTAGFLVGLRVNAGRTAVPATVTEPGIKAQALVAGMTSDPTQRSQQESAATAFNMLAYSLNLQPLSRLTGPSVYPSLAREASKRGMDLLNFSGSMKELLAADTPCMLELRIPGLNGYRYLALTGHANGKLYFRPAIGSVKFISPEDLSVYWTGRAYIPWRNSYKLPYIVNRSTDAATVRTLQKMLIQTGNYQGKTDGIGGKSTIAAIKSFQTSRELKVDGKLGAHTLLLLYRTNGNSSIPGLTGQRRN